MATTGLSPQDENRLMRQRYRQSSRQADRLEREVRAQAVRTAETLRRHHVPYHQGEVEQPFEGWLIQKDRWYLDNGPTNEMNIREWHLDRDGGLWIVAYELWRGSPRHERNPTRCARGDIADLDNALVRARRQRGASDLFERHNRSLHVDTWGLGLSLKLSQLEYDATKDPRAKSAGVQPNADDSAVRPELLAVAALVAFGVLVIVLLTAS